MGLERGTIVERRIVCAGVRGLKIEHERLPHLLTGDATPAAEVAKWNAMQQEKDPETGKPVDSDTPVHQRLAGTPALDVPAIIQNWWLWCKPGDLIGHFCTELVAPASRSRFLRTFLRQRASKDGATAEHRMFMVREDGGHTPVAVRVRLIERADGDLVFVGVLREITAAEGSAVSVATQVRVRHEPDQLDASGLLEGIERHIDDSHASDRRSQSGDTSGKVAAHRSTQPKAEHGRLCARRPSSAWG